MRCWIALSLLVLAGCGDDKTGEIVVTRCLKFEQVFGNAFRCLEWERRCYKEGHEARCAP